MTANLKTRMCWNCEGRVSPKEETCPYCGVSVVPASLDGSEEAMPSPFQALFSNYQTDDSSDIPPSPYSMAHPVDEAHYPHQNPKSEDGAEEEQAPPAPPVEGFKRGFLAILFLLGGSMLFLFSLSLAFFSHEGVFTLSWDATLWFVYGALSLPLLFVGWRLLSQLDEDF